MSPARSTDISHRPRHSRNPSRAHPAPQHPSQYSAAPAHPSSSMPSPLNASINGSRTPGFGRVAHTSPQEGRQVTTDVPPSSCSTTDSVYDRSSSTTSTVSRYAPRRAPPSAGSRHGPGPASSHLSPASIPSSRAMVLAAHSDAATIHLYNVPPQVTDGYMLDLSSKWGSVASITRQTSKLALSVVEIVIVYHRDTDAAEALRHLDGGALFGHPLRAQLRSVLLAQHLESFQKVLSPQEIAQAAAGGPRNLYVLNLSLEMTNPELERLFSVFGQVTHVCIMAVLDNQGKRRAFVDMAAGEAARQAISSLNGTTVHGYRLEVSFAIVQRSGGPVTDYPPSTRKRVQQATQHLVHNPTASASAFIRSQMDPPPQQDDQTGSIHAHGSMADAPLPYGQGPRQLELYVSNLDPCAILDDEDLARLFGEYGTVLSAKLAANAGTGQSLGYGVVKMSSSQEADFARTQIQGQVMGGKRLSVDFTPPMGAPSLDASRSYPHRPAQYSGHFGTPVLSPDTGSSYHNSPISGMHPSPFVGPMTPHLSAPVQAHQPSVSIHGSYMPELSSGRNGLGLYDGDGKGFALGTNGSYGYPSASGQAQHPSYQQAHPYYRHPNSAVPYFMGSPAVNGNVNASAYAVPQAPPQHPTSLPAFAPADNSHDQSSLGSTDYSTDHNRQPSIETVASSAAPSSGRGSLGLDIKVEDISSPRSLRHADRGRVESSGTSHNSSGRASPSLMTMGIASSLPGRFSVRFSASPSAATDSLPSSPAGSTSVLRVRSSSSEGYLPLSTSSPKGSKSALLNDIASLPRIGENSPVSASATMGTRTSTRGLGRTASAGNTIFGAARSQH